MPTSGDYEGHPRDSEKEYPDNSPNADHTDLQARSDADLTAAATIVANDPAPMHDSGPGASYYNVAFSRATRPKTKDDHEPQGKGLFK